MIRSWLARATSEGLWGLLCAGPTGSFSRRRTAWSQWYTREIHYGIPFPICSNILWYSFDSLRLIPRRLTAVRRTCVACDISFVPPPVVPQGLTTAPSDPLCSKPRRWLRPSSGRGLAEALPVGHSCHRLEGHGQSRLNRCLEQASLSADGWAAVVGKDQL